MNKKNIEYENRIALLSQEIERLNLILDTKNKEVSGVKNQLNQMEEMNSTIINLQDRIARLTSQNNVMEQSIYEER